MKWLLIKSKSIKSQKIKSNKKLKKKDCKKKCKNLKIITIQLYSYKKKIHNSTEKVVLEIKVLKIYGMVKTNKQKDMFKLKLIELIQKTVI